MAVYSVQFYTISIFIILTLLINILALIIIIRTTE